MLELTIDAEFKNLIAPLSNEEFDQLEKNILKYGILDPLKVWNGILIDGHNRYEIAQKHNLNFNTTEMRFSDREKAKGWIILNQFGRRNISTFERVRLALKLKPMIAAQAKKNSLANLSQNKTADLPTLAYRETTNEQIAGIAGVGKETVRKVEKIEEIGKKFVDLSDIVSKLIRGEISINLAYETALMRKEKLDELTEEIKQELLKFKAIYLGLKNSFEQYEKIDKSNVSKDILIECEKQKELFKKLPNFEEILKSDTPKNIIDLAELVSKNKSDLAEFLRNKN